MFANPVFITPGRNVMLAYIHMHDCNFTWGGGSLFRRGLCCRGAGEKGKESAQGRQYSATV